MPSSTTFAVPCCNGEQFLESLLLSLLAQTRRDFEILLVDDASEDDSLAVARRVAGDRIRIVENASRLGIVGNWNRCVAMVETPFFCLAHQDDSYAPQYLERMLAVLEPDHAIAAVHCMAGSIDETGEDSIRPPEAYKRRFFRGREDRATIYAKLYRGNYVVCPSLLYRSDYFADSGPFDASYHFAMDWVKNFELLLAGFELRGLADNLMSYRRHGGSASSAEERSLNRFREEQRVLAWARQRGISAGLLDQGSTASPAVHNNLLVAVYQSLESGDREQVRRLLEYGRVQVPGFAHSITAGIVSLCSRLGRVGRGSLRLLLELRLLTGSSR